MGRRCFFFFLRMVDGCFFLDRLGPMEDFWLRMVVFSKRQDQEVDL